MSSRREPSVVTLLFTDVVGSTQLTAPLACAVGIQRAISEHNREHPTLEFMVRMGLNAGEAIREEADFFGAAVIVATRLAALAGGGEILASETVKQLRQGF